ncbi:MAG: 2-hydroxyhepta-2,4-diene-1,7-dioate isomerase [Saprospiraceae bacterium]|nr:MAG: 2-hydroxyhepta-2,4-diene-1,7-dioate isomerase [Saprospiraceae bacterium]
MKIICIGRNYEEHARELDNPVPEKPVVFMKPSTALLVNDKPFYYPDFTSDLHHECEVVLKICKNGKSIEPRFASSYYEEITLGIDFTARDLQSELKKKGQPWELAKAFDDSAVVGRFLPLDRVRRADGHIEFFLRKNGQEVQHGHTGDLIFPFDELISFVSRFFTLQQGDLIFTGTPAGVGPVNIGDLLEGYVLTADGTEEKLLHCEVK